MFTKWSGYADTSVLVKIHTHLFLLGMVVFLLVALFAGSMKLEQEKMFRVFLGVYNVGVLLTAVMMAVRGIAQVKAVELSRGADAAISGVAGIGHILTGTGLVLLLLSLRKQAR